MQPQEAAVPFPAPTVPSPFGNFKPERTLPFRTSTLPRRMLQPTHPLGAMRLERDALLAELRSGDEAIAAWAARRRAILQRLGESRDILWPPARYLHGHRPPQVDQRYHPAIAGRAQPLRASDLRRVCLGLLERHGPCSLRDIHTLLIVYGYVIDHRHPVKALGNALAYEVVIGRATRERRAVYNRAKGPNAGRIDPLVYESVDLEDFDPQRTEPLVSAS